MAKGERQISGGGPRVKKGDTSGPSQPVVQHKDLFQRVNFTLQASWYLQQLAATSADTPSETSVATENESRKKERNPRNRKAKQTRESRRPAYHLDTLAKSSMEATKKLVAHNQMKLDPSIKRQYCQKCFCVLIPGLTARVRNRPSKNHVHVAHTTCLSCSSTRSIPKPPLTDPDFGLFGPRATRRHARAVKRSKVPFHERERPDDNHGDGGRRKSHTLWKGSEAITGWGEGST